jgi:NaMN:DMB phosphoribosyltransferase
VTRRPGLPPRDESTADEATDGLVDERTRLFLVAGTTRTVVDGDPDAGGDADLREQAPSVDAELVAYGRPVRAPVAAALRTPPTAAVVTRAVHDLVDLHPVVVDGGIAVPTAAPTVSVGARPGRDIREGDPVPTAPGAFAAARSLGANVPVEEFVVGDTLLGGTTTALAVMRALGVEPPALPSVPAARRSRRESLVAEALAASDVAAGVAAHHPELAVRFVGDPGLAATAGLAVGALSAGRTVVLSGGLRALAAAALVRHAGATGPLTVATTDAHLAAVPDLPAAADRFDCTLVATTPGFDVPPLESVGAPDAPDAGMAGALALADRSGVLADVAGRASDLLAALDRASDADADDGDAGTGGDAP